MPNPSRSGDRPNLGREELIQHWVDRHALVLQEYLTACTHRPKSPEIPVIQARLQDLTHIIEDVRDYLSEQPD